MRPADQERIVKSVHYWLDIDLDYLHTTEYVRPYIWVFAAAATQEWHASPWQYEDDSFLRFRAWFPINRLKGRAAEMVRIITLIQYNENSTTERGNQQFIPYLDAYTRNDASSREPRDKNLILEILCYYQTMAVTSLQTPIRTPGKGDRTSAAGIVCVVSTQFVGYYCVLRTQVEEVGLRGVYSPSTITRTRARVLKHAFWSPR